MSWQNLIKPGVVSKGPTPKPEKPRMYGQPGMLSRGWEKESAARGERLRKSYGPRVMGEDSGNQPGKND